MSAVCGEPSPKYTLRLTTPLPSRLLCAGAVKLDPVTNEDVEHSLEVTRPSAHLLGDKYEAWKAEFGSR